MKTLMTIALAAGTLAAAPVFAQTSSPQQMLQGLLTGNQNQDQAVRDAYERGYRAGRQDEARTGSSNRGTQSYNGGGRDYSRSGNNADRDYSRNSNNEDRAYSGNGGGYNGGGDRAYKGGGNYPAGNYNNGRND